jgi:ribose transport system ATP-binding protein
MYDADTPVLDVENIHKQFGPTQALNNVSVRFAGGEVHCLLGENGAGKSTLGKIIGGLYTADKGQVRLAGKPVRFRSIADARACGISMVFQELSLAPDLTVLENICLGSEGGRNPLRRLRRSAEEDKCLALSSRLGLNVDLDRRTGDLSVANQQLVEVAKAISWAPRILVLDEPTSMLGRAEKSRLLQMIATIRADGVAVIFVTHHIEEVLQLADRASLMRDGSIVEQFAVTRDTDADYIVRKLAGTRLAQKAPRPSRSESADTLLMLKGIPTALAEDVAVRKGEIVGLYGVAGCGRETIAKNVVGLARSPDVEMVLDGKAFTPGSPAEAGKAGVAYLPSGRAANSILPTRSIRENLLLGQRVHRRFGMIRARKERAFADDELIRLGTRYRNQEQLITSLSGGNQQKVVLGRCMGRGHKLLVLEDPTAGVDIKAKEDIHELIRQRTSAGVGVILVSSELEETIKLCDVVYTVCDNTIVGKYRSPTSSDEPAIVADILSDASPRSVPAPVPAS